MTSESVERVSSLSPEAFERDFLSPGRPVVLTGALDDWPAIAAWTPESLGRRLAGRRLPVAWSSDGAFDYADDAPAFASEEMDGADAAAAIAGAEASGRRPYLMQQPIAKVAPELLAEVPIPALARARKVDPYLWFGAAGCVSPLHFDVANNLFAQVYGRKRFTLAPPDHYQELAPAPISARHANLSRLDPERPDLARFPAFASVATTRCEVGPGDLLYLPPFYWHHVRSLQVSISVSVWWAPRLAQFLVPAGRALIAQYYRRDRLLSLRNLPCDAQDLGGFAGMSRALAAGGEARLAALFAGAALEDAVRRLHTARVGPLGATAVRDLPGMIARLAEAGALDEAKRASLEAGAASIERALEGEVGRETPAALLTLAEALELLRGSAVRSSRRSNP